MSYGDIKKTQQFKVKFLGSFPLNVQMLYTRKYTISRG